MAEIRHFENRHDVIFSAEGGPIWIKFWRLVQNNMSTAVMWSKSKPECRILIWRTFGRIQWHVIPQPRVTLQGAATWWIHCHDSREFYPAHWKSFSAILIFLFLMQFRLWRAAAFVSSPIQLVLTSYSEIKGRGVFGEGRPTNTVRVHSYRRCLITRSRRTQPMHLTAASMPLQEGRST